MVDIQLFHEDCITGLANRVADNSIDLTITSIPFEEIFQYSGKLEDVGNNGSTVNLREGRFALNLRFVIEQLFRVTRNGANVAIHIQQLLAWKVQHGFIGRRDFRGAVIDLFSAGGFHFTGEVAIPKNPQRVAQQMKLHSLMFVTGKRNARALAPAPNDYFLIFQKPGECEYPVRALYDKTQNPEGWVTTEEWIKWAKGSWNDIRETDVLDGYRAARESDEEKHICPLQLEPVRRFIKLYSNPIAIQPNSTVIDPFSGIGSVGYIAVEQDRNYKGFELKDSYHSQAVRNIEIARKEKSQKQNNLFEAQTV